MTITQPQDVRDAYEGEIPTDRDAWLQGRIAAAERLVASHLGDLHEWVGSDADRRANLVEVVAGMVLRLVRNPDAYTQESETIGPASYSTSRDPRAASGTLWLTSDDRALLGIGAGVDMPGTMYTRRSWW